MQNTIEGREVDSQLIQSIQEPHIVSVEMLGEGHERHDHLDDLPSLKGYIKGQITRYDAEKLPNQIRKLVVDILNSSIGKVPNWEGRTMRGRFIEVLEDTLMLGEGLEYNPGRLRGEVSVEVSRENEKFFRKLNIAESGYTFSHKRRKQNVNTSRRIFLDTTGEWLSKFFSGKSKDEIGDDLVVVERRDDGELILANPYEEEVNPLRQGNVTYRDIFLPIAEFSKIDMGIYLINWLLFFMYRIS